MLRFEHQLSVYVKCYVLGFQRAIHQPYYPDLALLDIIYFWIWSRIYDEHNLIIEQISAMRYKNTTDH